MSFDATEGDIQDFFSGCAVTSVRIVEDKLDRKPKGFGYAEFATLDGLKKALEANGTQFQGRNIRVSVAEPRKSNVFQILHICTSMLMSIQKRTDLMLANLVTGHERGPYRIPEHHVGFQIVEDSAPAEAVADLMQPRMRAVTAAHAEVAMSQVMVKYATLAIGIAKDPSRLRYHLDRQREASTDP